MPEAHKLLGFAVVGLFAVGWLWGLAAWVSRRGPGGGFWIWLTVAQVAVGVQAVVGSIVFALGYRAESLLHYAYGIFPFAVLVIAHVVARDARKKPSMRTGKTLDPWVPFAWAAFICFGLTLRALMTGLGLG